MSEVEFTCILQKDTSIKVSGVFDTNDADDERPIQWYDYGLKWYFPRNPFNPDNQIAEWNRYEELSHVVQTDSLLIQYLCDFADEDCVKIHREGYWLIIGEYDD